MRHLLVSLLATVAACATSPSDPWSPDGGDEELDSRVDGKADGQGCEFSGLAGLYEAFGYRDINPEGAGWNRFRIGMFANSRPTLDDGAVANLKMYLLPENRAILDYSELVSATTSFGQTLEQRYHALVVTTVSVDDADVVHLGSLAHGPFTQMSEDGFCVGGIQLTFDADVHTAGLRDSIESMWMGTSSAWVVDPDHLDQIPSDDGRAYYTQKIADGSIDVIRM